MDFVRKDRLRIRPLDELVHPELASLSLRDGRLRQFVSPFR